MEESTISIKKSDLYKYGFFVLLAVLLIGLLTNGFGMFGTTVNTGSDGVDTSSAVGSLKITLSDDDPVLGDPNAKITVVEFSDFECPFCGRALAQPLAGLKSSSEFAEGEVNLVYKQFPLNSIHPNAQKAAEASLCAHDQGKFWEYHDVLFTSQSALSISDLKAYAVQLDLDATTFNDCLDSDEKESQVNRDLAEAAVAGGRGTPYFVVYNKDTKKTAAVSGAVPYSGQGFVGGRWTSLAEAIEAVK